MPEAKQDKKKRSRQRSKSAKETANGAQAISNINKGKTAKDVVRVIPLGGVEEVGKNMTVVEFRDSLVVVDIGVQFTDEETPGVDYIIPDTTYLEARKKRIKGAFITLPSIPAL
jgi:ribonuclease J